MLLTATNKQIMEEYEVLRDLYMEWLPEEVAEWICSLGFPHYKECFTDNLVSGRKLIWIDASTLPSLGITDWRHIQIITSEVRKLLNVQLPDWNRSITLPRRCERGLFLERKSQSGHIADKLKLEH